MAKATQTKEVTHLDILNEALERADSLIGKLKFQEMAITPADPGQIASWQQELAYAFSDIWKSIKIVPELRKLIPPLLPAEREGLHKSIKAEGIRDHLSLWQAPGGQLVLVDGHNRFEIAMETHEIFTFRLKDFPSVAEAQNWMIDNQLSRRNLSDEQRRYLIGKRYQAEKGSHGGSRIPLTESPTASVQTEHLKSIVSPTPKTVERVAKELKVSPSTVKRADKFAAGADRIGEHSPQLQGQILSGEVKLPKGQVEALDELPDEVIAALVATLESVYPENPEYARELVTAMLSPEEAPEEPTPGEIFYAILSDPNLTDEQIKGWIGRPEQALAFLEDVSVCHPLDIDSAMEDVFEFCPDGAKEVFIKFAHLMEDQELAEKMAEKLGVNLLEILGLETPEELSNACRECGCTDHDCTQCIEETGSPCYWSESDLCSRCAFASDQTSEEQIQPTPQPLEMALQFTSIEEILAYADKHRRKVKAQKLTSSESDEYATPQDLWDVLNAKFHFSLDVAATAENAKCARYFTMADDGLAQSWAPLDEADTGAGWMNHPYSQTEKWLAKAFETAMNGERTMVCFPKVDTSTNWWWDYCRYGQVLFLPGRYKFNDGENGATFANAVVIFPKDMATNPKYRPTTEYWDWTGKRNEKLSIQAGSAVRECGGVVIDDVVFMRHFDREQTLPNGLFPHTWRRYLTIPSLHKGKGRLG